MLPTSSYVNKKKIVKEEGQRISWLTVKKRKTQTKTFTKDSVIAN